MYNSSFLNINTVVLALVNNVGRVRTQQFYQMVYVMWEELGVSHFYAVQSLEKGSRRLSPRLTKDSLTRMLSTISLHSVF